MVEIVTKTKMVDGKAESVVVLALSGGDYDTFRCILDFCVNTHIEGDPNGVPLADVEERILADRIALLTPCIPG